VSQSVALAVGSHPQVSQARLVLVDVEPVLLQGGVERNQLLVGDVLRVLGQVIGEHVRGVTCHEGVVQLVPIVVPSELADLDLGVRVRCLELVGALLVCRLLGALPEPVVDLAGDVGGVDRVITRAATATATSRVSPTTAGGQGEAEGRGSDDQGTELLS
jgi:hypothetical protein